MTASSSKRRVTLAALAAALGLAAATASAGLLTSAGVSVLDQTGAPRGTFSNNETITFQQKINNGAASANRTQFSFQVTAPNGHIVFKHFGNSVPGTVGNAASQVSGIPIAGFFQGPGIYSLTANASLDGVTIAQTQTFTISSPNVLLIYPPNGAQNLTDNPLTFQWFSSGASSYRLTVADNPSLYNAVFQQTTSGGANILTYPQNPTDPRQRLAAGQLYYWKVEGLDVNGNVVAQSQVPFSFSVQQVVLTRDLAVTGLDVTGTMDSSGGVPFRITVKNQGSTTESNISLRVTFGGLSAPNTPITIPQLLPGSVYAFDVTAQMPVDQNQSLAIACLTIFDDNVANNCKTLQVSRPPSQGTAGGGFNNSAPLTADQIWQAIQQLLKQQGTDLTGYGLVSIEGSLTRDQLAALLDQLRQGQAQAILSGPALNGALPTPVAPAPALTPPPSGSGLPPPPPASPDDSGLAQEWSGYAAPLAKTGASFTITNPTKFRRLWERLRSDGVPKVDFNQSMVIGIIAGKGERVDKVEIESKVPELAELLIRYRYVVHDRLVDVNGAKIANLRKEVPYYLTVAPRSALKVRFEQVKEDPNE